MYYTSIWSPIRKFNGVNDLKDLEQFIDNIEKEMIRLNHLRLANSVLREVGGRLNEVNMKKLYLISLMAKVKRKAIEIIDRINVNYVKEKFKRYFKPKSGKINELINRILTKETELITGLIKYLAYNIKFELGPLILLYYVI